MYFLFYIILTFNQVNEVIDFIQKDYKSIKTFQANFIQTNVWPELDKIRITKGRIFVRYPESVLLYYTKPKGQFVLISKEKLYIFSPKNKQLDKYSNNKGNINFYYFIYKLPKEAKEIKWDKSEENFYHLIFYSNEDNNDFERLEIWFEKKKPIIKKIKIIDDSDSYVVYEFNNIKLNKKVSPNKFKLNIPKDAKIIIH